MMMGRDDEGARASAGAGAGNGTPDGEGGAGLSHDPSVDPPFMAARDPHRLFGEWLEEASRSEPNDPNALALASVDADGLPNVRMVLLKGHDERGFVFYTNLEGVKGRELLAHPMAAMCFHWKSLRRQVRVRGPVETVGDGEADAYYRSRGLGSRIGAWASRQSRPLASRAALMAEVERIGAELGDDPPRPPHWTGFRLVPREIEFWRDGEHRLHDRLRFTRDDDERSASGWSRTRLQP